MAASVTNGGSLQAAALGLLNAVLQLVVAFGVNITDPQNAAITAVVNGVFVVGSLVLALRKKQAAPGP